MNNKGELYLRGCTMFNFYVQFNAYLFRGYLAPLSLAPVLINADEKVIRDSKQCKILPVKPGNRWNTKLAFRDPLNSLDNAGSSYASVRELPFGKARLVSV